MPKKDPLQPRRCAELLEKRLTTTRAAVEKLLPTDIGQLTKAERALKSLKSSRQVD